MAMNTIEVPHLADSSHRAVQQTQRNKEVYGREGRGDKMRDDLYLNSFILCSASPYLFSRRSFLTCLKNRYLVSSCWRLPRSEA